ncbi:MAG: hypothetical protein ACK5LX_01275 [Oscillospiraceae bacterium]
MKTSLFHLHRLTALAAVFLAALLVLSGCSLFSQEDSSADSLEESSSQSEPSQSEPESAAEDPQTAFDAFVERLKSSSAVAYDRTISYTPLQPVAEGEMPNFMRPYRSKVYEKDGRSIVEYKELMSEEEERRSIWIIQSGTQTYWTDPQSKLFFELPVGIGDRQDNLYYLASRSLTVLEVSREQVDGKDYDCFEVAEDTRTVKWYFGDDGMPFLRSYSSGEDVRVEVRYDNITFGDMQDDAFALAGHTALKELPDYAYVLELQPEQESEAEPEETSSEEESSEEESSVAESSGSSSSSKAESSSKPSSSASSAASSTASSAPQQPSLPFSSEATVITNPTLSSSSASESSASSASSEEESTQPTNVIPDTYPRGEVPLPAGLSVAQASLSNRAGRKVYHVSGTVSGAAVGPVSLYDDLLSGSSGYSYKESYSEENGQTYYYIKGTSGGWSVSANITEYHNGNPVEVSVYVEK